MTDTRRLRNVPIGLTLATLVSLAILIALGMWQLERLAWKSELLAQIASRAEAPPRPAREILDLAASGEDLGFYRVSLTCPGLDTAPFIQLYAIKDGQAGQRLISACPVAGGGYETLLVDRGFVPDTVTERPVVSPGGERQVAVTGLLRNPDPANFVTPENRPDANVWYSRDVALMASTLGVQAPAPVFLLAETPTNPEFPALEPTPLPGEIANRHLEYALTWFGLAGALLAVYAAVLWRRWKT